MPRIYASTLRFIGTSWILTFDPNQHPKWILPSIEAQSDPPRLEHHSAHTLAPHLARLADQLPSAFIFHIGRCGSTWLGRLLDAHENVRVLYEPRYLCNFIAACHRVDLDQRRLAELIRPLIRLTSGGCPVSVRPIVKWPSHALAFAPSLRETFPDIPQIILLREPLEVLAALVNDPPEFLSTPASPWISKVIAGAERETQFESVCGSYLEWLLRMAAQNCFDMVLDYRDLPGGANRLLQLARFPTLLDPSQLRTACKQHSKMFRSEFIDDSVRKRTSASKAMCQMAEKMREDFYSTFLASRH